MSKSILVAVLIASTLTSAPAEARSSGEERLARLLRGRVAEPPIRCISYASTTYVQVIDRTALVYGLGRVVYVNRTRSPRSVNSRYVLVYRNRTGQLCRSDTVHMLSQSSRAQAGFINLDNFVPWRQRR